MIGRFSLSETQAQHILDMPLKRLTGLERKAIEDEYQQLCETVERLTRILAEASEVDRLIKEELEEVARKYSDKRRTVIEESGEEIDDEDMIAEENMVVSISHRGYAKRCSPSVYRSQRRGGKGVMGTKKLTEGDDDFVSELFVASTHAYLLVFTSKGKLYWLKVYTLPEAGRTARGRAIVNMLNLSEDEQVSAILPVREFVDGKYVVMATRNGYIKRVDLMAFSNVRRGGIIATTLDETDELIGVRLTEGVSDLIISSKNGMAIRFSEYDVRPMGRTARGVRAISLTGNDDVVNVAAVVAETTEFEEGNGQELPALLTVCQNGFGKRTLINEYRRQGRGGKGVIDIKTTDRNGPVVGSCRVKSQDDAMLITTAGKVIRIEVDGISLIGRNTMGVNLVNLDEGESVGAVARVAEKNQEENDEEDEGTNGEELSDQT